MSDSFELHLPNKLLEFVKQQCGDNGLYHNPEEFIRDLIRQEYFRMKTQPEKELDKRKINENPAKEQSKPKPAQYSVSNKKHHNELDFDLEEIIAATKNELS